MDASPPRLSRRTLLAALAGLGASPVWAGIALLPELASSLPGALLNGAGRMVFLGLHVCDIRLWVTDGFSAEAFAQHPLAIEIEYARALEGQRIAERAIDEMQRIAPLSPTQRTAWLAAMKQAFPDIAKGERLTGVLQPGEGARFFHNGKFRAQIADADFARGFFAIWLSPKTSEPELRLSLLGART
jgi:hypothetical protein